MGNNIQVFVLHLRRNGTIQNRFHIALDGSKGRAEIMGNIGDKGSLVLPVLVDLVSHVIQGIGKVTQLVL